MTYDFAVCVSRFGSGGAFGMGAAASAPPPINTGTSSAAPNTIESIVRSDELNRLLVSGFVDTQ